MERPSVSDYIPDLQNGISTFLPDGSLVYVQEIDPLPPLKDPDKVSVHEAEHGVAGNESGTPPVFMTNVPNPEHGSEGETHFTRRNAVATAATIARRREGTAGDEWNLAYSGANAAAAIATAAILLDANQHKVDELASDLSRQRTMNGWDIQQSFERAERRKEGIREFVIFVTRPDKIQITTTVSLRDERFAMPDELVNQLDEIPQAA